MADGYTVKITEQAMGQLREISHYVAYNLQASDTALRLLDTLEDAIASLSLMPARIALTDDEPWHSYGIHKMPVKNFLVYFWIDETARKVQVTAVIYGRRDQVQQLQHMDME
ncbi:MAG: type II toxin-antitoxin system RelE/ParE family toxin [Syntrophomonadaceae bacterium]|nr:type II toxin-antitoxin system RelE/ParE family toxin [Syntrophomonadaceae bacterium]